jgi:ZIP family zinc transporter
MTEPLGAILAILVLYPFLSPYVLAASTAMVAGMMVFICFDELIPVANRYGSEHLTSLGTIAGFLVMILASSLL